MRGGGGDGFVPPDEGRVFRNIQVLVVCESSECCSVIGVQLALC